VRRVLMDATSWVLATDLLDATEPPNAVNVFDLAIVVETLILHDEILILSTYPPGSSETRRLRDAVAWVPDDCVTIEQCSPIELMKRYVRLRHPECAAALGDSPAMYATDRIKIRDGVSEAENYIYYGPPTPRDSSAEPDWVAIGRGLLAMFAGRGGSEDAERDAGKDDDAAREDLETYLEYLRSIHRNVIRVDEHSWVDERLPAARSLLDRLPLGKALRTVTTRRSTHDALATYEAAGKIFDDVTRLYDYGDPSGGSPHAQWTMNNRSRFEEFATALVLRAHFYLMASEVLSAPYKADALRWPICWKRFGHADWPGVAAGDRAVQLVEDWEAARLTSLAAVIDRGAIHLRMPLFLRAILSTSQRPDEVLERAVAIRNSKEARRFRGHWRQLGEDIANEQVEQALEGVAAYGNFLTRKYAGGESARSEVLLSVLTAPAAAVLPTPELSAQVALGDVAIKSAKGFARWWRERRFALISKSVKQLRDAKSLNGELQRVLGTGLDAVSLDMLERLEGLGSRRTAP
jgi:hypothetical protein